MAASITAVRTAGSLRGSRLGWALHHLLSFEALFVLFLYSNEIKVLLPPLPLDETVLFAALSIGAGAVIIAREGIYLRGLPIFGLALLFVGLVVASYGWTPSRILAKERLAYLAVFNMWCVIAGALVIAPSRERTLRFLCLMLLLSTYIALRGLDIYVTYGDFRRWPGWGELGFSRTYLNWGYIVADGAGIALVFTLLGRLGSLKQLAAAALLVICAAFLLVGGARAPILGLALAGLVATVVRPPRIVHGRFEISLAQLLALALALAGGVIVAWLLSTGQATTTLNRFVKLFNEADNTSMVMGPSRWRYWPAAFDMWWQAPLLGNGFNSFTVLFRKGVEDPGAHPHNVVLQVMAELGLVGLVLFGLFLWSGLRHLNLKRLRHDPLLVCVLIYFTTGMMNAMFAKELAGGRKLFFLVGLLALQPLARTATPARARPQPDEPSA